MFNLSYEEIVERIKKEVDISDEEIEGKVKQKLKHLSGLISKEGAAHIVANNLGVKIFEGLDKKRFKVKELIVGIRNIEIVGKVMNKYEVKAFKNSKGEGKVASFVLGDETGTLRVVLWGNLCDELSKFNEGDVLKIKEGMVRQNNLGFKELHLTSKSVVEVNPEGETVGEVVQTKREIAREKIVNLRENDFVEILGTIVQVFDPRFYDSCPLCRKKVESKEGKFVCDEHGPVTEKVVPILNFFFDDGTGNIRVVCFRTQVEMLLGLSEEELLKLRTDFGKFEDIKNEILGKQIFISGKVKKNEMFERLELVAQSISEADPKVIAEELVKDVEEKD